MSSSDQITPENYTVYAFFLDRVKRVQNEIAYVKCMWLILIYILRNILIEMCFI